MNPWSSFGSRLLQNAAGWYVRKKKKNPLAPTVAAVRLVGGGRREAKFGTVACSDFWSFGRLHATQKELNMSSAARRRAHPLALKWIAEAEGEFSGLDEAAFAGRRLTRDGRLLTRTRMFSTRAQFLESRELLSSSRQPSGGTRVAAVECQADNYLSEEEEEEEEEFEDDDDEVEVRNSKRFGNDRNSRLYSISRPRLLAPIRDLIAEAVERGYAKKNAIGLARATSQPRYSAAEDRVIVNHYSSIIRCIVSYYAFVNKRSSLWKVTSIYRKSCALTLARKHSMRSAAAAFKRFGPYLRISEHGKEVTSLYYPTSLKTTGKFNTGDPRYCEVSVLQEPYERSKRGWG